MKTALIVDDEPDIRELLELTLARMGLDTHSAANIAQAKALLIEYDFSLCLTDMRLPDGDGLELIEYIQTQHPRLPVAMITAHGNMDTAIHAMKLGAFDFVSKPVDLAQLRTMVNYALTLNDPPEPTINAQSIHKATEHTNAPVHTQNAAQSNPTRQAPSHTAHSTLLIGESEPMKFLNQLIEKVSRSQASIYIQGESGTGKELVAKSIHLHSPRHNGPFIPVNCSAIPSELLESEFFGHIKGSFTGATTNKQGLFRAANGGTLFLDEVADLPQNMQVKLLRAIQEKSVRPVGAHNEEAVDVRIVSATHKDLATLVNNNLFRQDLFYRINVIQIDVPPLRNREGDIALITEFILNKINARDNSDLRLSAAAHTALSHYQFMGNVRELENILERASALCSPPVIDEHDLQLTQSIAAQGQPELIQQSIVSSAEHTAPAQPSATLTLDNDLASAEATRIKQALNQTQGNITAAAKLLGLSFRQLRYRIKKLGL